MPPSLNKKGSVILGRAALSRSCAYLLVFLFSLLSYQVINAQTASQRRSEARALEPGKSFEREIKPGETHSYLLRCDAGQFTQINVEQRGSNVAVVLFGVDDGLILRLNTLDETEGNKLLPVLADVSGVYRVDVRGRGSETGRYEMNTSQPRHATQQDRDYAAAEMMVQEARLLVGQGTGQSKRNAIGRYRAALPLLRSAGNREGEAVVLNNIGLFYRTLGELNDALDFFNQALTLRREIGDRRGEAISLNHLGRVYVALGEIQRGLDLPVQIRQCARAQAGIRGSERRR